MSANPPTTTSTAGPGASLTGSVSISKSSGPFAASGRPLAAPTVTRSAPSSQAPAMAHSHTLKLIPAGSAPAAATAAADQPVDLAAKPKPAVTVGGQAKSGTLRVPNLSGLIPGSAVAASSPARSPATSVAVTTAIHTLRIPTLSQAVRPVLPATSRATLTPAPIVTAQQVITAAPGLAVVGRSGAAGTAAAITRPGSAATLLTVPGKNGAAGGVNVAVVQQVPNKVVLQAPSPGARGPATTITGIAQVPRGTATTIIRPPSTPYIRAPTAAPTSQPLTVGTTTTAIRLTAATQSSVQFVPVSGATLRTPATATAANQPTVFRAQRPGAASGAGGSAAGTPVRVTLVQSSVAGGKPVVSQPSFYKPVTITSGQPVSSPRSNSAVSSTGPTAAPVRIGPNPLRAMALPISQAQPLTVSVTPTSHISLPQQQNLLIGKQPLRFPTTAATAAAGKILQMPIMAAASQQSGAGQPSGVTIQKTTIPANPVPRTISLPYGTTTQVSAIPTKPAGRAVMTSQPLTITSSSAAAGGPNLVTITSNVGADSSGPTATLPAGSVYVARPAPSSNPQLAINLTNTNPAKIISQSSRAPAQLSLDSVGSMSTTGAAQIITTAANKISLPTQPTPRFVAQQPVVAAASSGLVTTRQQLDDKKQQASPFNSIQTSSRPGMLGRRDGERDPTAGEDPVRDVDREDAGSSTSGSTTLSATSSPGGATAAAVAPAGGGDAADDDNPSPRKKLRKQQFSTQPWMSDEINSQPRKRKVPSGSTVATTPTQAPPTPVFVPEKPRLSLINSYRHTWRSRHNHFLRHSDVKVKEDRRPTVNELANQRQVLQKIDGWKVYHLSSQMESIVDMEVELTKKLNALGRRLDKTAHSDLRDLSKVQELIKANLQRSKVVQEEVRTAKEHALELFEHRDRVKDIVKKYVSKRQVRKRDLS